MPEYVCCATFGIPVVVDKLQHCSEADQCRAKLVEKRWGGVRVRLEKDNSGRHEFLTIQTKAHLANSETYKMWEHLTHARRELAGHGGICEAI